MMYTAPKEKKNLSKCTKCIKKKKFQLHTYILLDRKQHPNK